jgi:putative flavoprotein involved in K+ transport
VWTTGFRPDLGWLPGVAATPYGWPVTRRGLVEAIPGLAFVGMPFQYSLTSGLIGGVGRDADYVAEAFARSDREPLALAVGHRKR